MAEAAARLPDSLERFVLLWGDMGGHWGVNRSIAQIHALLYVSERPMVAEEISDLLGMARSNVSNSLRELQAWNLIHRVPVRGDRRDHFAAETDLWEVALRIAEGRKQREIDPARQALRQALEEARDDAAVSGVASARLEEMDKFVDTLSGWYADMVALPRDRIVGLVKMGSRISRLIGTGDNK